MISFESLDFKCFIHTAGIQRAEISISFPTTGDSSALVKPQHFQGDRKEIEDAAEVVKILDWKFALQKKEEK